MPNSAEARRERVARLAADPTIRPHGKLNTYSNWGCTCAKCTAAYRAYLAGRAAAAFPDDARGDREQRREKLRAMGFEVNEATEDVI